MQALNRAPTASMAGSVRRTSLVAIGVVFIRIFLALSIGK